VDIDTGMLSNRTRVRACAIVSAVLALACAPDTGEIPDSPGGASGSDGGAAIDGGAAGGSGTGGAGAAGSGVAGAAGNASGNAGSGGGFAGSPVGTAGGGAGGAPAGTGGAAAGTGGAVAGRGGATAGTGGSPAGRGGGGASGGGGRGGGGASGGGGRGGAAGAGGAPSGTAGTTGTGGAAVCTGAIPAPPADMKQTIDITWTEMSGGFMGLQGARGSSRRIQTYKSWALDHVMWSQGNMNFCVRWDSNVTVTATMRDQVQATLQRGVDAWFSGLAGYDCFPYSKVNVKVTGWAVRNRATLDWTDDTLVPIYVNQLEEGAPTCPATCSRFRHQDKNYDFAQCPGGAQNRFDQFVWLDMDYDAPNGWDMGAHVNQMGFTNTIAGTGLYHIWLHEFGHSIGFPDYYDWSTWAPGVAAPRCVMNAGAATTVTDWDKWMFKRTWSELLRMNRWP